MKSSDQPSLQTVTFRLLWVWLFLPILICGLIVIGATGFLSGRIFQAQQRSLNLSVAYAVRDYVSTASQIISTLADEIDSFTLAQQEQIINFTYHSYPYFDTLYVLDPTGRIQTLFPGNPRYIDMDMSNQEYFRMALLERQTIISPPFISVNSGQPAIYLSRVSSSGSVVVGELKLSALQQVITTGVDLPGNTIAFVTDESGTLLAHPDPSLPAQQVNFGQLDIIKQGRQANVSSIYTNGTQFNLGAAVSIQPNHWIVVTQTPLADIYTPYYGAALLILVAFTIIALYFGRLLLRQFDREVIRPMARFSQAASAVAGGDYVGAAIDIPDQRAYKELNILKSSFKNMTAAIQKREKELAHLATYDQLTGLPNRALFQETLAQRISQAQKTGEPFAVFFIDLDDFKAINDAFGHRSGDMVLQNISVLISTTLKPGDLLGRLGGDEFVLIIEGIRHPHDASIFVEHILDLFNQPYYFEESEIYLSASIGVALFPEDGANPETLIQKADTAMYKAKRDGKNNYQFFSLEIESLANERLAISSSLHHALEFNEFSLHYQPIVEIETGRIVEAEALLRWFTPKLGSISPDRFIPVLVETGLILPVGEWVLRNACLEAVTWQFQRVSVNISERQLKHPRFAKVVANILAETGLPPERLELELTENIFFQNLKDTQTLIQGLKDIGVSLALDDFGTGYSTLSCLTQIPFDRIKIDRSLAQRVIYNQRDANIVHGIIHIAADLGMDVITEGIETKQQLDFFRNSGSKLAQGYYYSRPQTSAHIRGMMVAGVITPENHDNLAPDSTVQ